MSCQPKISAPNVRMTSGIDIIALTQKRRVMSINSGLGPSSSVGSSGSSAIPQIGQLPDTVCLIWGCIGQVHMVPAGTFSASIAAESAGPCR